MNDCTGNFPAGSGSPFAVQGIRPKKSKAELSNMTDIKDLIEQLKNILAWIDAFPNTITDDLPKPIGWDRECVEQVLSDAKAALESHQSEIERFRNMTVEDFIRSLQVETLKKYKFHSRKP